MTLRMKGIPVRGARSLEGVEGDARRAVTDDMCVNCEARSLHLAHERVDEFFTVFRARRSSARTVAVRSRVDS